jgi:glycine cleavage system H protein
MSIILALLAAIVIVAVSSLRARRSAPAAPPVLVKRYTHHGHAWARETDDGAVLVGVDDFAQSLLGPVDTVRFPRLLRHVRQGEPAFTVGHGAREITFVSPVTGWVVMTNDMVRANPGLLNDAPYGDGWIFRVHPVKLAGQLNNLLSGREASQWLDATRAKLAAFFSTTPALMYQDGGTLMQGLADRCSDDEWRAITKEFFLHQ